MTQERSLSTSIESVKAITIWLLIQLAEKVQNKKEVYLKNILAKSLSLIEAIDKLYTQELYNEGWTLFRTLIDRYVYLVDLCEKDLFEEFEKWSFVRAYEYNSSIRSDENFKSLLNDPLFKIDKKQTKRYYSLKKEVDNWSKPNPESILKSKGLDFLYKYGYDYSSGHIHPVFGDGELEFYRSTGLEPNPFTDLSQKVLLRNSILVNSLIQREVFNRHRFKFRRIVYQYLDETLPMINDESNEFDLTVYKILKMIESGISLFEE
jgi:hypothetical protein